MFAYEMSIRVVDTRNEEAAAVARELEQLVKPAKPWHIYISITGERPILTIFMETESVDGGFAGWGKVAASPGFPALMQKWDEVTVRGTRIDRIWQVM